MVPGLTTLLYFQDDLKVESYTFLPGTHYILTSELFRCNRGQEMGILIAVFVKAGP
ncbi:hypothetical protein L0F63_006603 [Massospora cicadina]|nr:hypothetical protein L0F63_006603 [Massospora cicadina]